MSVVTHWGHDKMTFFRRHFYTLCTKKLLGGILVSLSPSVCPSVRPASRVRYIAPTVLVGSILYLYILSSNFRGCVACIVSYQISKFEFLAVFQNLKLWLCLVLTWALMWITSMGNHCAAGVSQNTVVLVVLVWFVLKGPINNITTLVQIMAWHRPGDRLLSESIMVSLLMRICVTWLQ